LASKKRRALLQPVLSLLLLSLRNVPGGTILMM
jgi:hypothetical protein